MIGLAICAALVLRYTARFGIATEAAAESRKAPWSPDFAQPDRRRQLGVSSAVAGSRRHPDAPITTLSPFAYSLFLVPALAMRAGGQLHPVSASPVDAGLVIWHADERGHQTPGCFQLAPWQYGLGEAVPLVLILAFLLIRGQALPGRGALIRQDLGASPRPNRLLVRQCSGIIVVIAALYLSSGSLRLAVIMSLIFGVIALSQLVITGYAGQCLCSAQLTLAGAGAFSSGTDHHGLGLPFPWLHWWRC